MSALMGSNTGATQQKKQDLLVKLLLAVARNGEC